MSLDGGQVVAALCAAYPALGPLEALRLPLPMAQKLLQWHDQLQQALARGQQKQKKTRFRADGIEELKAFLGRTF